MSLFNELKDYLDYISHEREPQESHKPTTHVKVRSLGIPSIVIVKRSSK